MPTNIIESAFENEIVRTVILSLVSAVIFWAIFTYFPNKFRWRKLRPIVHSELQAITSNLYFIFDELTSIPNSPSFRQHDIAGYRLTLDDLRFELQNKCLNDSWRYYPEIKSIQISVGNSIIRKLENVDRHIANALGHGELLKNSEIMVLSDIRKIREQFLHNELFYNPVTNTKLNGRTLRPADSSMSWAASSFYDLYLLFVRLDKITPKNTMQKISCLYNSQNYKKCKRLINRHQTRISKDNYLDMYLFDCEYRLGNKERAYFILRKRLQESKDILSLYQFFSDKLDDNRLMEILKFQIPDTTIKQMIQDINKEKTAKRAIELAQEAIMEFHRKKLHE